MYRQQDVYSIVYFTQIDWFSTRQLSARSHRLKSRRYSLESERGSSKPDTPPKLCREFRHDKHNLRPAWSVNADWRTIALPVFRFVLSSESD